jgi:hypothetical protein
LRPLKVPLAFIVLFQTRTIGFIVSQRIETDQSPGDVVGSFVRKKIADEVTTTAGNDATPLLGVGVERCPLKGVDLIANKAGDGHCAETSMN